ncbi:MAG TPA: YggT family protein [Acidimicrobiales bacterium]|nr:YggT family protein [Acidimicrobiales bacterium]
MILVHYLLSLYIWVFIIAALLSWFPSSSPNGGLATTRRMLYGLTEPVLRPIRQILPRPRVGGIGIDFSVLVAIILLEIVNRLI